MEDNPGDVTSEAEYLLTAMEAEVRYCTVPFLNHCTVLYYTVLYCDVLYCTSLSCTVHFIC